MKPLRILIVTRSLSASSVIGILQPLTELKNRGLIDLRVRCNVISIGWEVDLKWCDVAIFNRWQDLPDLYLLYDLKRNHKKIIFDMDDNFFEIPLTIHQEREYRHFTKLYAIKEFYRLSDITRVYSKTLKTQAESYAATVRLVKSYFNIPAIAQPLKVSSKIKIAFATIRHDDPSIETLMDSLFQNILLRYEGRIELHLWNASLDLFRRNPNVILHKPIYDYKKFINYLSNLNIDIGLAPLLDSPFYGSKSNNKYREYGGLKIAGIYSDVAPYKDSIIQDKNGILVANTVEAWLGAVSNLIDNASLRKTIVETAYQDVKSNYSFEAEIATWYDILTSLRDKLISNTVPIFPYLDRFKGAPIIHLKGSDTILQNNIEQNISLIAKSLSISFSSYMTDSIFLISPNTQNSILYIVPSDQNDIEQILLFSKKFLHVVIDCRAIDIPTYQVELQSLVALNPNSISLILNEVNKECIKHSLIYTMNESETRSILNLYKAESNLQTYLTILVNICFNSPQTRREYQIIRMKIIISSITTLYQKLKARCIQLLQFIIWTIQNR